MSKENKIRISVTISRFLVGQGWRYANIDIKPLWVDARVLTSPPLLQDIINNYCVDLASNITPYNPQFEDYILGFWLGNKKIVALLLSNYAHFFRWDIDADVAD